MVALASSSWLTRHRCTLTSPHCDIRWLEFFPHNSKLDQACEKLNIHKEPSMLLLVFHELLAYTGRKGCWERPALS